MFQVNSISLICLILFSCASLMQKDKKVEFSFESPNIRVEKFPETFNLRAKGVVKTQCPANNCSAEQIDKMDAGTIKGFIRDGAWEEYMEMVDKEDPKKKYSVLWMKGIYANGKKEGIWEEFEEKYDESSKTKKLVKKQFGPFKDNKKDGIWTLLYETGEKLKETPYVEGKKHGAEKKFSIKGIQTEEINYVQGERHGNYWKKTTTELAMCEGTFTKEQKTGKWTEYTVEEKKPGKLKAVLLYNNNKRDGAATLYHPDGVTKASEGNYKEDYKTGTWKQYYPTGAIESEGARKPESGTIESEEKEEGGESETKATKEVKDTKTFKEQTSSCPSPNVNGKSNNFGEWKRYYKSGDVFSVGSYDEKGLPIKDWKFFYKGNKLRCKGTMSNSIMMKNGELYDKAGSLEGKGNIMLSLFSIDDKTDEMKDKMIPALPFTFYKDGKKYLEILPASNQKEIEEAKEGEEVRRETIAKEYDPSGKLAGEGGYIFIPTQAFGGKKHGCWTEGGKKVSYMMGKVQTGRLAEMSNCK